MKRTTQILDFALVVFVAGMPLSAQRRGGGGGGARGGDAPRSDGFRPSFRAAITPPGD
jgi:hypothetical protein